MYSWVEIAVIAINKRLQSSILKGKVKTSGGAEVLNKSEMVLNKSNSRRIVCTLASSGCNGRKQVFQVSNHIIMVQWKDEVIPKY